MQQQDNPAVAAIIRDVMAEYGAVGCGYSSSDSEVDTMYEAYPPPDSAFFVIEWQGKIQGCGGVAPLSGGDKGVCELRKMYFLPSLRGLGMGSKLLKQILAEARSIGYNLCYLETVEAMKEARRLYERFGFTATEGPMGNTGHSSCNRFMTLDLTA